MRRAADAGARIVNDVAALGYDPNALRVAAESGLPVVLMHAQGDPRTMQLDPRYDDVVLDVYDWLEARIAACEAAGIARERMVVDPGIGFGKTLDHNLALLSSLSIFHGLGCPILLGASRKSFIGRAERRRAGRSAHARLGGRGPSRRRPGRADPARSRCGGDAPGAGGVGGGPGGLSGG